MRKINKIHINKRVAFATLGCKVNSYDTETMLEIFEKEGYSVVEFSEKADVYVVNTCTVTHLGDRKSRNLLRKAKRTNPEAIVIAVGCYVQVACEEVKAINEVDILIGTQNRAGIINYIKAFEKDAIKVDYVLKEEGMHDIENLSITETKGKTRGFLKVQEGCNQFCTYCIIPYARGKLKSRALHKVIDEVKALSDKGYREVVLTGIHLASYGLDLESEITLIDLVKSVDVVEGIKRIRLGSLDPRMMSDTFIAELSKIQSFCPHFHLSLQSGCTTVLQRMGRNYTTEVYASIVDKIRSHFDLPSITTDIMVGFPGETDEEFEKTCRFVEKIGFYQVHVFKYSKRKGTKAAEYKNQVSEITKNIRSAKLIEVSKICEQNFLKANDGQIREVLFEEASKEGVYYGHTSNYVPVEICTSKKINGKIKSVKLSYQKDHAIMRGVAINSKEE